MLTLINVEKKFIVLPSVLTGILSKSLAGTALRPMVSHGNVYIRSDEYFNCATGMKM